MRDATLFLFEILASLLLGCNKELQGEERETQVWKKNMISPGATEPHRNYEWN
jgi:hypothetical protein